MAADHHHFVLQLRIGARNFCEGVIPVFVVAGKFSIYVHLHGDGYMCLQQARHASIILNSHDYGRRRIGMLWFVRLHCEARPTVGEDEGARASTITTIAAW